MSAGRSLISFISLHLYPLYPDHLRLDGAHLRLWSTKNAITTKAAVLIFVKELSAHFSSFHPDSCPIRVPPRPFPVHDLLFTFLSLLLSFFSFLEPCLLKTPRNPQSLSPRGDRRASKIEPFLSNDRSRTTPFAVHSSPRGWITHNYCG